MNRREQKAQADNDKLKQIAEHLEAIEELNQGINRSRCDVELVKNIDVKLWHIYQSSRVPVELSTPQESISRAFLTRLCIAVLPRSG